MTGPVGSPGGCPPEDDRTVTTRSVRRSIQPERTWLLLSAEGVGPTSTAHEFGDEPAIGRILVIDDEQRILNFVRRGLEAEGMLVDAAGDGAEGLRMALSTTYDLIVLDLVMPGLDGHAVLRRIMDAKPSQPVLILSALNDTASKVSCLERGSGSSRA